MIMEIVLYLIGFLSYVFIQGLVINGLKACTEGNYETRPDGKVIAKGMIFFRIAQYFNRHDLIPIYYKGEKITELLNHCKGKYANAVPVSFFEGKIQEEILTVGDMDNQEEFMVSQFINKILKTNESVVCSKISGNEYVFFKEYERYRFPSFIRKSIALSCIKCSSSFWGTVTFLPVVFYFGLSWWIGIVWVASVFSLTHVNYYLYKHL